MDIVKSLIKTLTVSQLLLRWPRYSRTNIFEFADEGCFGTYVNPLVKRKTYYDVNKSLEKLVNARSIPDAERKYYIELYERLLEFITLKGDLLLVKPGYARLATKIETDIFPLCETTSIQRMIGQRKIPFFDFNNTFGFEKNDNGIISSSYLLTLMFNGIRSLPDEYIGYFSDEDMYFFIDQIEKFEDENKALFHETEKTRGKNGERDQEVIVPAVEKMQILSSEENNKKTTFSLHEDNYKILYLGKEIIINATKGACYIEHLIKNPHKQVHVNDLTLIVHKDSSESVNINNDQCEERDMRISSNTSEASFQIEPGQIKFLLKEIDNLDEQIRCAEEDGESELIEDLKGKKQEIESYLDKSTFNGRPRKFVDDGERRRQTVCQGIKTALNNIKKKAQ